MDHVLFLMAKNGRNLWSPISAGEVHCFLDHLDPVQWVQVLESEIMFQHRMFSSLNRHILTYSVQILVDTTTRLKSYQST